jgi:hypothetical protein
MTISSTTPDVTKEKPASETLNFSQKDGFF